MSWLINSRGALCRILERGLTDEKIDKAKLRDVMISAAVAADKRQLLRGEPTVITAEARESYERLAERVLKRALGRGETVTLEAVKLRIVQRKPEARPYLLPEVGRGEGVNPLQPARQL